MSFRAGTAWGFELGSEKLDWRLTSACRDHDPEYMWPLPTDDAGVALARMICADCPVRIECLTDGIDSHDWQSVRGGFTGPERRDRHKEGYAPADYPPPRPRSSRICMRCTRQFDFDPAHPYARICERCDVRRKEVRHA